MMSPKRWFRSLKDRNRGQKERLLVIIGLCGLAVININGIANGADKKTTLPLVIAFLSLAGVAYFSLRLHKIQMGAVLMGAIIIYFVLPFTFLTTGGIYGGGPINFLFGVVYTCLVIRGKKKYVFLASSFIISGACYYIAYNHPEKFAPHTLNTAYADSLMSLLIIGVWVCAMILFRSESYRLENALVEQQKQEIEELNRAQNRFFSGMSREIRTPINTIIGLNEMILREDVSDEVATDATNIQGASKMLLTLINDFLDMSKIGSGKMDIVPVTYDVGAMLSDIVNMIWVRAKEKGLEFHIDVDRSVPAKLIGDEVRIKQILINVLNNAVKYTQEGSVTLSIQTKQNQSGYAQIIYSVTDTGMGIKEENLPHLFSAFERVDEEKNRYIEGTGLGLSIVKQLVELMRGEIEVNSVYTKGTTFVITLPQRIAGEVKIGNFNMESRHALGARWHYKQSFEAPKAHVLIVDDNETNLMVTEKLLRDTKVQTDTAISGTECLKRTVEKRYEVILMDHLMPGMDGIECLRAIRTQTGGLNQSTPIVILTANTGRENQALYRREGFAGYLSKPVSGKQLETELLRHLPREVVSMTNEDGSVGVVEAPVVVHKTKLPVMITTGSVCDLPEDLVEKYQIAVMPFRVCTEEGEFLDGIEAETDGILAYMSERGKQVRSDQYGVSEYEEFFTKQLTRAQHIIHITMGKNLYYEFPHAAEAAKAFDNVTVIDSGHVSSGMGLIILQAAKYAADGMSAEEIVQELKDLKRRTRTSFIVGSTEYLMRAGRMTPRLHSVFQTLMLHPMFVMKNDSLKLRAVSVGSRDRVWKKYIASTLKVQGEFDTGTLFITHAGLSKEELDDIREQVQKKVEFQNVIYQKASSAISIHCGPGTFGLIFMMR